jgi:ABC-type Fe3+/spermidine/putrescine transport system ATPase subunit
VLILIRPEAVELVGAEGTMTNNGLTGEIISHTFLGAVTRVKVHGEGVDLTADVPTSRVRTLPIGMNVVTQVPADGVRLLSLAGEEPPVLEPDDH